MCRHFDSVEVSIQFIIIASNDHSSLFRSICSISSVEICLANEELFIQVVYQLCAKKILARINQVLQLFSS